MDKPAVRAVLEQIAASLALKGDNAFRIRAFENAASAIATYPGDLAEGLQSGALAELDGVGKATLEIVRELLSRGRSTVLDELRNEVRRAWWRCSGSPGSASRRCGRSTS